MTNTPPPRFPDDVHKEAWNRLHKVNGPAEFKIVVGLHYDSTLAAEMAERDREIAKLRAELAMARIEGWKAGRDAADDVIENAEVDGCCFGQIANIQHELRALTAPAEPAPTVPQDSARQPPSHGMSDEGIGRLIWISCRTQYPLNDGFAAMGKRARELLQPAAPSVSEANSPSVPVFTAQWVREHCQLSYNDLADDINARLAQAGFQPAPEKLTEAQEEQQVMIEIPIIRWKEPDGTTSGWRLESRAIIYNGREYERCQAIIPARIAKEEGK